jgi:hypothetical protein
MAVYFTAPEIATALKIGRRTVYRKIASAFKQLRSTYPPPPPSLNY